MPADVEGAPEDKQEKLLQKILKEVEDIRKWQMRMEASGKTNGYSLPSTILSPIGSSDPAPEKGLITAENAMDQVLAKQLETQPLKGNSPNRLPFPEGIHKEISRASVVSHHTDTAMEHLAHTFADTYGAKYLHKHDEDLPEERNDEPREKGMKKAVNRVRCYFQEVRLLAVGIRDDPGKMWRNAVTTVRNDPSKIILNPYFELFSAFAILMHSLFIGLYVDHQATSTDPVPAGIKTVNSLLVGVFIFECVAKLAAEKDEYFFGKEKHWNAFDMLIVGFIVMEFMVRVVLDSMVTDTHQKGAKALLKMGEVLRTFRVLRIFKVLRFSASLRMIMRKISGSLMPLVWVIVLIFLTVFVLAVTCTNGASQYRDWYLELEGENNVVDFPHEQVTSIEVDANFGSIEKSIITVFQTSTGGKMWSDIESPLRAMSNFYFVLYVAFTAFMFFAGMNMITGIFVDVSLETASEERDLMIRKKECTEERLTEHLREDFLEMTGDHEGWIEKHEFEECIQNPNIKAYLRALGICTKDADQLFRLLDEDNSGTILLDEFVEGCMKLKGEARSMDMHILTCEHRRMWAKFALFCDQLDSDLKAIHKALRTGRGVTEELPTDLSRQFTTPLARQITDERKQKSPKAGSPGGSPTSANSHQPLLRASAMMGAPPAGISEETGSAESNGSDILDKKDTECSARPKSKTQSKALTKGKSKVEVKTKKVKADE